MPKCKKSSNRDICEGCLTSGRKLSPIKEYFGLYKKLLEDVLRGKTKLKKIPHMCSECRSTLHRVQNFQKQATEAYESLIMVVDEEDKMIHHSHLPTDNILCLTDRPSYEICDDLKINHEQTESIDNIDTQEEVKTELNYNIQIIKEENDDYDIKMENDYVDIERLTEESEYVENVEESDANVKNEVELNEMSNQIKLEKAKLRKAKCIITKTDYESFTNLCSTVKIDDVERERCIEVARNSDEYLNSNFKCDKCVMGYSKRQKYEKHMKIYHSESNQYECEVCSARFSTKLMLVKHVKGHSYKHTCSLCGYERVNKRAVLAHLAHAHRFAYECRQCGLWFRDKYREFYKHNIKMHKRFVCDYCGFRGTSKQRLINHIRVNHCENVCKYCNKRYTVYHSMVRHIALRHTKRVSEESYCVECNVQFDNITLYTRHLKTSVKHKPKIVFPCTECPNVYAKKTAMMNHYKYIHLQKTNYYCEKCSRYFLNGFRLRTHIATYHNNIQAPKNKICSYCGRGFVTNRILDNHIRTHTGERPFACSHCTATFAQKSALVTHARAIHKVMMRYATKD